ncbi:prepilin-type N-terminal cleavage/methylation domain-containing protein [[Clostridium] colinum]|uniref:prepilin-type N-terminal cleavage/methylation domain-containing protein n=1 Tax=[Clostridium] colinum TaxID=36835 RepID=UPI002023C67F|nr:prepilin-type N-terminal cleavage/methylation domain-containing protein [[Clostridium] colinum]
MNKKGYSLLEIIISITIFSIFIASITTAFFTYIDIDKKNNIITIERINIVSNLELFLSSKSYNEKNINKITLIKKEGLKEFPKEIICIEKEEKSSKSKEKFKAFIKLKDKNKYNNFGE